MLVHPLLHNAICIFSLPVDEKAKPARVVVTEHVQFLLPLPPPVPRKSQIKKAYLLTRSRAGTCLELG